MSGEKEGEAGNDEGSDEPSRRRTAVDRLGRAGIDLTESGTTRTYVLPEGSGVRSSGTEGHRFDSSGFCSYWYRSCNGPLPFFDSAINDTFHIAI